MPATAAIIGSGNIGTDLLLKILRGSGQVSAGALVGIDSASDGLARAARLGVLTTADGVAGLIAMDGFGEVDVVFDATSAGAHRANAAALEPYGVLMVDLTPAALGPFVVPAVNLDAVLATGEREVNMVTCGGQATVPIVAAVSAVTPVRYAEIIATIASASAGPGTRANIDEFTQTTARALQSVGGARSGRALIVLNPADPPMIMRDTVLTLVDADVDRDAVTAAVHAMVEQVAAYVPGYRLKREVQFSVPAGGRDLSAVLGGPQTGDLVQISVYLEVTGAAHYLPAYAGNLDIMTSAALRTAEAASRRLVGAL